MEPEYARMKALSIRQPWAWLILHAGKIIENRTWWTGYRGPLLIHAAKGMTRAEYEGAIDWALGFGLLNGIEAPAFAQLERGGIVGHCNLVDCVRTSSSPWFCGPWGFALADCNPLPFRPFKGSLGFFEVPDA